MTSFNDFWNKKSSDIASEGKKAEDDMNERHKNEQQQERKQL